MPPISWHAPEFETKEKSPAWFGWLGVIVIGLIVFAVLTRNYFFVPLVLLMGFVITQYALKAPRHRTFTLDELGVKIDNQRHSFETLSSFWVFYDPPRVKELSFRSKQRFMPYIRIPLADQDPVQVRQALVDYLPERKHREWLVDDLMRKVGF